MNREQLFRLFFLVVLVLLLLQVLHILSPFFTGIFGAIVLSLIFHPLHRLIQKILGPKRPNLTASVSVCLIVILTIVPFCLLSWMLILELSRFYPHLNEILSVIENWHHGQIGQMGQTEWLTQLQNRWSEILPLQALDLHTFFINQVDRFILSIIEIGKSIPRHTLKWGLNLLVMIFTLFFLLRDGSNIFRKLKELIPMNEKHKDQVLSQLYITVTAIVRGVFLVAVAQGVLAALGFWIIGMRSALLFGFVTMITSTIPIIGATAVWLPIAIMHLIQGSLWKGVFLCLWGAGVVSLIDNIIRIWVIGNRTKLPILLLFFGLIGGIKVYGPKGLFLGPLVVVLLLAFVKIYREIYPSESSRSS